ncbi:SUMF1/EgtB/PvdO family nonheme iron enzyme [Streptomyces canus]|uniref:SUMF1/EgtB/PvdO family nonheme iron enzyme n=1 Tax=Streptomyces canus TaxID=58343 RepID=UPI003AF38910
MPRSSRTSTGRSRWRRSSTWNRGGERSPPGPYSWEENSPTPLEQALEPFCPCVLAPWHSPEGPGSTLSGRGDHPVVHVSWNDASVCASWAGRQLPNTAPGDRLHPECARDARDWDRAHRLTPRRASRPPPARGGRGSGRRGRRHGRDCGAPGRTGAGG